MLVYQDSILELGKMEAGDGDWEKRKMGYEGKEVPLSQNCEHIFNPPPGFQHSTAREYATALAGFLNEYNWVFRDQIDTNNFFV